MLHISSNGNIIVKIENLPKIGDKVVDENLNIVGEIFDIFGPVSAPYAAVKLKTTKPENFVNKPLYVLPRSKVKGRG